MIDLVESFLMVYLSSQTERFSLLLGQLKVYIHIYIIIHKNKIFYLESLNWRVPCDRSRRELFNGVFIASNGAILGSFRPVES